MLSVRRRSDVPTTELRGDWERGYAKGYERPLRQVLEITAFYAPDQVNLVRNLTDKLRKDALDDEKAAQNAP